MIFTIQGWLSEMFERFVNGDSLKGCVGPSVGFHHFFDECFLYAKLLLHMSPFFPKGPISPGLRPRA